jgi:ligand-binding SRPBCC domain-containing protein
MTVHSLDWTQYFARPVEDIRSFFSDVRNLNRLLPSSTRLELLSHAHTRLVPGMLFDYRLWLHGVPVEWRTVIEEVGEWGFSDSQVKGPYSFFRHTHIFQPASGGTLMLDRTEYAVPGGPLEGLVNSLYVRGALLDIFASRRAASAKILGCEPGKLRPS